MFSFNFIYTISFIPFSRFEEDSDELSDRELNKILIVTQTPTSSRAPKHEGYDRTGDWSTRVKISQELEQAISDGLYYYESGLWMSDDYVNIFVLLHCCNKIL